MTHNNNHTNIEELPPGDFDNDTRKQITGYQPQEPIDTGASIIESQTVKNIVAQREDNPYLRLTVLMGVTGIVGLFLWLIFALISPKAPEQIAEEPETEEPAEIVELEPDYQAKLALTDQFYSLEKKPKPELKPQIEVKAESELPPVKPAPVPAPTPIPVSRPAPPRPVPRPVYRSAPAPVPANQVAPKPKANPQEQWLALADFGTGVAARPNFNKSRTIAERRNLKKTNSTQSFEPALLVNRAVSQGELGILNRRTQASFPQSAPSVTLARGTAKAKIELPLVWDSSLLPQEQQTSQLTIVLEEPLLDLEGQEIFAVGSVAIVEVRSINNGNGLVSAYVSQINDTLFQPGELILRNKKKSALVAKGSKRSDFGDQLLIGGVNSFGNFGQQLLQSETSSTTFNGSTTITSQSRNSFGRDLAGSTLDGFSESLGTELQQRNRRNQIGDGGSIYTLSEGTTVYITNVNPIKIAP